MFSPGSKILETTTKPQRRSCICKDPNCKALTLCFQSVNDVRGSYTALPSTEGKLLGGLKEFKLKRSLVHLGLFSTEKDYWACSVDNRDRSGAAVSSGGRRVQPAAVTPDDGSAPLVEVDVRTRVDGTLNRSRDSASALMSASVLTKIAKDPSPLRSTKYIANHHFHPAVLRAMLGQGHNDCISVQLVKEFDLIGKGYTNADLFNGTLPDGQEGPVYVPTPSYKDAKADYQLVSTRWRLNKMIAGCRAKSRGGNCTLAPRGEDDILQPVEKRGRVDTVLPDLDPENKADLQRAIVMLADERDEAYAEIDRLKDEIKLREALWRSGHARLEQFTKQEMGGLCRLNISSDVYHENNPNVAKTLFAFEDRRKGGKLTSWMITKEYLKVMFDVDHEEPTLSHIFDAGGRRRKMSRFEQCLITLMWFQNLYEHEYIASIFGCNRNVVATIIKWWAPHFHEVGCQMARLPLDTEFLRKAYPQSYIDLNFSSPVASVVDGTDVLAQTVRIDRAVNVIQRSDKVKASAFRGVTWSLPYGAVHEFTDPFFGRGSEQALVKIWAGFGRFRDLPIGWLISGDKGFAQTSAFYPYYHQILHPAFLTGGKGAQFTDDQMDWNRKACEMRYTSEVVFSRFKKYGGLGQIMHRKKFYYVHYLWAWAHGMANTYLPLQTPANCTYFPESKYKKKKD